MLTIIFDIIETRLIPFLLQYKLYEQCCDAALICIEYKLSAATIVLVPNTNTYTTYKTPTKVTIVN